MDFTIDQLEAIIKELDRELKVRKRVYPRWTETGKITKGTAEGRIRKQEAAKQLIEGILETKRAKQLSIF